MKRLFSKSKFPYIPWSMVRSDIEGVRRDYWKLFNRYSNGTYTVDNTHPLVQLLTNVDNPDSDPHDYIRIGLDRASVYMDNNPMWTTELNRAAFSVGTYTHYDNIENTLVSMDVPTISEYLDIDTIAAFNVLWHPYSTLDLPLLDGLLPEGGSTTDIVVLTLDVGLLLYQYYLYKKNNQDMPELINVKDFIHTYVILPAALSYFNIAIFNLAMRRLEGTSDLFMDRYDHPVSLSPTYAGLDKYLSKKVFNARRLKRYGDILLAIPSITDESFVNTISHYTGVETPFNKGVLYLSRFFYIESLIRIGGKRMIKKESTLIRSFLRETKSLRKGQHLEKILPREHPVLNKIDTLVSLINTSL